MRALPLLLPCLLAAACIADDHLDLRRPAQGPDSSDMALAPPPRDMAGARPDLGDPGPLRLTETDGLLVVEVEHYESSFSGSGRAENHRWERDPTPPTPFSAQGVMLATPNADLNLELGLEGPRLSYLLRFERPGTLYLWVRMYSAASEDNSVHLGLDGIAVTQARWGVRLPPTQRKVWAWTGERSDDQGAERVQVEIGPGESLTRRLDLWMREDGVRVDKVLLTRDKSFVPKDLGPNESPKQ